MVKRLCPFLVLGIAACSASTAPESLSVELSVSATTTRRTSPAQVRLITRNNGSRVAELIRMCVPPIGLERVDGTVVSARERICNATGPLYRLVPGDSLVEQYPFTAISGEEGVAVGEFALPAGRYRLHAGTETGARATVEITVVP
jgi:hypothetical protein